MNNLKNHNGLSEEEYRKKVLAALYDSNEPREVIIGEGRRQVEELIDAENRIKQTMEKLAEKYENQ